MDEEELMWLAGPASDDSEEWAAELEQGTGGWHGDEPPTVDAPNVVASVPDSGIDPDVEQRLGAVAAEEGWDESEVEAIRAYLSGVQPPQQAAAASDDGGAAETAPPASAHAGQESPSGFELPGGDELDEALAALRQPAAAAPPAPAEEVSAVQATQMADRGPDREWAKSHEELEALASAPRPDVPWPGMEREPRTMPPPSGPEPPATTQRTASENIGPALEPEPEWMRGRQDAAARAYRRLRRIFPNSER